MAVQVSTDAEVFSLDTIQVLFDASVVNDSVLASVDTYVISASIGLPPAVVDVMTGYDDSTNYVILVLQRPTEGVEYTVTVVGAVQGVDGTAIDPSNDSATFTAHKTKIDGFLRRLPNMYTQKKRSLLQQLMSAILREDQLIGGDNP